MDLEVFVIQGGRLIYYYPSSLPFLTDDERIMVSAFLTAIDSFSQSIMKDELRSILFANYKISFRRDIDFLVAFISPEYDPRKHFMQVHSRILDCIRANRVLLKEAKFGVQKRQLTDLIRLEIDKF